MAVSVKTAPTFSLETPRILFRGTYVGNVFMAGNPDFVTWDVSPDGKRFLMMKEQGTAAAGSSGPKNQYRPELAGRTEAARSHG